MSNEMVDYLRTRRACCVAELAQIDRLLAATGCSAGDTGEAETINLAGFNPAWKRDDGHWLSDFGGRAIFAAYGQRMRQRDVCILFRVTSCTAHNWHRRWKLSRRLNAGLPSIAVASAVQESRQ